MGDYERELEGGVSLLQGNRKGNAGARLSVSASCQVDYVTSKAVLLGLTRCLAVTLAPTIQVNAICPGVVETDMIQSHPPEWKSTMLLTTLLKRFGGPEDIANAAA